MKPSLQRVLGRKRKGLGGRDKERGGECGRPWLCGCGVAGGSPEVHPERSRLAGPVPDGVTGLVALPIVLVRGDSLAVVLLPMRAVSEGDWGHSIDGFL